MNVAFFASGEGSNAELTAKYLKAHDIATPRLLLSNRKSSGALKRAKSLAMMTAVFSKDDLKSGRVLQILEQENIDLIVLQGFLQKLPPDIVQAYKRRSLNQHPALLPKYGGPGLYGRAVHEAVAAAGDRVSGFSLHRVNDHYDEGDILFQKEVEVEPGDADQIEATVRQLENDYVPTAIAQLIMDGEFEVKS